MDQSSKWLEPREQFLVLVELILFTGATALFAHLVSWQKKGQRKFQHRASLEKLSKKRFAFISLVLAFEINTSANILGGILFLGSRYNPPLFIFHISYFEVLS